MQYLLFYAEIIDKNRKNRAYADLGHINGKRTTGKNQVIDDWIRETKDYPRFPLVEQTQPGNQLANRRT